MIKFAKSKSYYLVLCALVIITLLLQFFNVTTVVGTSMYPTLENNRKIIVSKYYKNINRGDIVIASSLKDKKYQIVKRIIGLPGDKIQIENKKVYINDELLKENYIQWNFTTKGDLNLNIPIIVPQNHYFVLGDNRDVSYDSRLGGAVPKENIIGKVLFVKNTYQYANNMFNTNKNIL